MDDSFNRKDRFASHGPIQSPYLNFDPAILKPASGSQFIIPEGQGERRGKMEMAFSKIGFAIIAGGAFGGLNGFFSHRQIVDRFSKDIKISTMIDSVSKQSAASARAFGTLALMYSLYDTALSLGRGVDDELNMCVAGAATGATYSISQGLKKSLRGGIFGFALVGLYLTFENRNTLLANINA